MRMARHRERLLALVIVFLFTPVLNKGYASTPNDDDNAVVRTETAEINRKVDQRYAGVAASLTAYRQSLRDLVAIHANLERDVDGKLKPESVHRLAQQYELVSQACAVCSGSAETIDKTDWTSAYGAGRAKLEAKKTADELARQKAMAEQETLTAIPSSQLTLSDQSRLNVCKLTVEQTQIRLLIYEKALATFDHVDKLVNENDTMISQYRTIFDGMSQSYHQLSLTCDAIVEYERLKDVEKAVNDIVRQPATLSMEVDHLQQEWKSVHDEIRSIIGG